MSNIKSHKTKKFKCHCLQYPGDIQDMYLETFTLSDSSTYISECNGCDFYTGSAICEKCRAIITLMFRNGYELLGNEILKPDVTVLPLDDE